MFGGQTTVQIARQASGGTAITTMTSFHPIPHLSATLETAIAELGMDSMRNRFDEGPVQQGLISVQGDVGFRWQPEIIPVFFYGLTNVISSTNATPGSVSATHWFVPIQTEFDDNLSVQPWTIEEYKDGQRAHQYTDSLLSRLTLEIAGGQLLRGTGTYMARVSSEKAQTAPTYRTGVEVTWNQASVSLGGAGWPSFETLTFVFDNALEFVTTLDGTQSPRRIRRSGFRTCRVSGTIDLPVNSISGLFPDFRAGTERTLVVTVEGGTAISSGGFNRLKVDIPTFRYSAKRYNVTGPGRVTVGFDGRAVYNVGSAMLFLLSAQNSFTSY